MDIMKRLFILAIGFLSAFQLMAQEVPKKIVLEHFTNTRCSICASKNPAFFNTIDAYSEVIHVAYHPTSPYPNCLFASHNVPDNNGRTDFYSILGSTPRVVINGAVVNIATPMISDNRIQMDQNLTTPFSISTTQQRLSGNVLETTIVVSTVAPTALTTARLYVALSEKTNGYNAPNGENEHHNVFRKSMNGVDGVIVNLPAMGSSATFVYTTTLNPEWVYSELTSTAILQDEGTREVLQGDQSEKFDDSPVDPVSINELAIIGAAFYPNPANEILKISNELFLLEKATIYNIIGRKVVEIDLKNKAEIALHTSDFSSGTYIIKFTGNDQTSSSQKLLIQH